MTPFDEALFEQAYFEAQDHCITNVYDPLVNGTWMHHVAREACRRYLLSIAVEDFEKPDAAESEEG